MLQPNKFKQGNYAPVMNQLSVQNISPIFGKIPDELHGALYRNGPNPQFPTNHTHWFEGDGMLHRFYLHDGKLDYQNRWVDTERLLLERRVGKASFGEFGLEIEDRYHVRDISHGTANTNIIHHAGKLLALQELSPGIAIEPHSLATLGVWDYHGNVPQTSAHPHVDPFTQEMHSYAYDEHSAKIIYYVFDKTARVIKKLEFMGPYASFMHDFAISKQYVLFLFHPLTFDVTRPQRGLPLIAWEPALGTHVAILPRNGSVQDIQWFSMDAFHAFHYMNAFEEGAKLVLHGMKSKQANLFPDLYGKIPPIKSNYPRLTRWVFDLKAQTVAETVLSSTPAEFPRYDERFTGVSFRHGYAAATVRKWFTEEFNAIIHYDLVKKTEKTRYFGLKNTPSEPVFVPRHEHSPEGDGFILTVVFDAKYQSSNLYILDAMQIDKDPIAIIPLPQRVPNGFHGNWYSASELGI